jgi:ELWxxDGT repeat protein
MTTALQPAKSATDTAGDLFLSGTYFEIGISSYGNFGTTQGQTPSGFAQAGAAGVGLTYNQAGFGVDVNIPTIDFFTPGAPYESFAVGYSLGGTNQSGSNYKDGAVNGVAATSLTDTSAGSQLSAEWVGILHGNLQVTIDYSFGATSLYFTTKVTLTNISGTAMDDVRYDREVDPDNTVFANGDFSTINTIVAQQPGSGASEVTAASATGDPYYTATGSTATLFYYSTDPKSLVSDGLGFGGPLDPFNTSFTTGAGAAGSTTGSSDTAININYDGGALAAGASTAFTYYTGLTDNVAAILSAINTTTPTVTAALAADTGSSALDQLTSSAILTGAAEANGTVTVSDGTSVLGTTTATAGGTWNFTPIGLTDGSYTLTASETDLAGNTGSASLSFVLDTTLPVVTEALASDTGASGTDGVTNNATLTGAGEANAVVTLTEAGIVIGAATADAGGAWSAVPRLGLPDGAHTVVASETDLAGNAGSATLGFTLDATAPTVGTVTASPATADLGVGQVVTLTVNLSEAVTVTGGVPALLLNDGGTASYTGGSGTNALTFSYTVAADQNTADLAVTGSALNGASILDAADNAANLAGAVADPAGTLRIDTTAPAVSTVTASPATADLGAGQMVTLTVSLSDAVTVTGGVPALLLNDGGTASYTGGSGTNALTFSYMVAAGQNTADLAVMGSALNGASILDEAGNAANLAGAVTNPAGILQIDTTAPAITAALASDTGSSATDHITSSAALTGTAEANGTVTISNRETLLGTTVADADGAWSLTSTGLADGSYTLTASETDQAGNTGSTTLGFTLDTMAPTVGTVTVSPATANLIAGQAVMLTVGLSEAVAVAGGVPTLALNDGGIATYDAVATAALNNPSKLVFGYTVALTETSTPSLVVTGFALNGATILDPAGTAADLSGAVGQSLGVTVDTKITWLDPASGDWTVAGNWSAGVVPGASNKVLAGGTASTNIVLSDGQSAYSLTVSDPNAFLHLSGTLTLSTALTLEGFILTEGSSTIEAPSGVTIDAAAELITSGNTSIIGNVINNSTADTGFLNGAGIIARGYLRIAGDLTGSGLTEIAADSVLELNSTTAQSIALDTGGAGGATLRLDDPADFSGTITGLTPGFPRFAGGPYTSYNPTADQIDLAGVAASTATATYNGGILVVDANGRNLSLTVASAVPDAMQDATLSLVDDGNGGSSISWNVGLSDVWSANGAGSWADGSHWSLGFAPGTFDTASFSTPGAAAVTIESGTIAQADLLTLDGPAKTIAVAGQLSLGRSPVLAGGTIALEGGTLSLAGGVTLDNASITDADGAIWDVAPPAYSLSFPGYGGLTLGPNLTLTQLAGSTGVAQISAAMSFTNDGTIDAAVAGGRFEISVYAPEPGAGGVNTGLFTQVANAGVIDISNGESLSAFGGSGAYLTFDNAITGTLSIIGGASATVGGVSWSNEGNIVVGAGSTLTLEGNFATASLNRISYAGGTVVLDGIPTNNGLITASGGLLVIDPSFAYVSSYGTGQTFTNAALSIDTGATLELRGQPVMLFEQFGTPDITYWGGDITSGTVTFNGGGATLKLDDPHDFTGTLGGLTSGDQIDFAGVAVTQAAFTPGSLTITTDTGTIATFGVQDTFWADEVSLASDGAGGTLLTLHPDTTPPAVTATSVKTDTGATDLNAGHVVTITLALREVVTVTGTPGVTLSDGATALYQGGSGTNTLTFTTTVQAGQNTPDLTITGINTTNGTIQDLGGNPLASTPATDLGLRVDTTVPAVTIVSISPAEGVFKPGQAVQVALHFSKAVLVSGGIPTLTLSNGGVATSNAAATTALGDPAQLLFTYTVQPIDTSTGSPTIAAYQSNGSMLSDAAGNVADLTVLAARPLGFGVDTSVAVGASSDVYFIASAGGNFGQVWKTDGTSGGTTVVAPSGIIYSNASNLKVVAGAAYFTAVYQSSDPSDPLNGQTVNWKTDGTSSGTLPLGPDAAIPAAMLGSTVISEISTTYIDPFNSFSSSRDVTLVATDTTGSQTILQNWHLPYLGYINVSSYVAAGNTLYFLAPGLSNLNQNVLWQTDGTPSGTYETTILQDAGTYYDPNQSAVFGGLTAAGGNLFFFLNGALYSGVGQTISLVAASGTITYLAPLGDSVYFISNGYLYESDGTSAGTSQVGSVYFDTPTELVAAGNRLYVLATDPATGIPVVWAVDGSTKTAVELSPPDGQVAGINSLTAVGDKIFFVAFDEVAGNNRLWVSDGTAAGTTELASPAGTFIDPEALTADGSKLFFRAYDAIHGLELWSSDGTTAGTSLVSDIAPGTSANGGPGALKVIGTAAYFLDFSASTGSTMLWRTDGSAAGTSVAAPLAGGYSNVTGFAALGTQIYFLATEPAGSALWKTDGTAAGTVRLEAVGQLTIAAAIGQTLFLSDLGSLQVVTPASPVPTLLTAPSSPDGFTTVGSTLYFRAYGAAGDQSTIWRSDGTQAGTTSIAGTEGAYPITPVGPDLYYYVYNYLTGSRDVGRVHNGVASQIVLTAQEQSAYNFVGGDTVLYFTNGLDIWRVAGTTVTAVTPADGSTLDVSEMTVVGDELFFLGYDSTTNAIRLWRSDGTTSGTVQVVSSSGNPGNIQNLQASGGKVYFSATDSGGHQGLWKSDGSASGTVEITTGGGSITGGWGAPALLGSIILVPAYTQQGLALFATDGTDAGTRLLNLSAGPAGSYPNDIIVGPTSGGSVTSGLAIDGYIAGGTVFADANGNGKWDPGEAEATTDAQGNFLLQGGSGPLVLIGGVDTATGLAFAGTLEAPSGSSVVTPLTTVVQALLVTNPSQSLAAAEQQVSAAFGITLGSGQTLTSFDPIAGTLANAPGAAAAFAAQASILDSIDMIGSALTGIDTSLAPAGAASNVLSALANAITAQPGRPIDLTNPTQITSIINVAAALDTGLPSPPDTTLVSKVAAVVSASNNAVQQGVQNGTTPQAALQAGSAVEQVAQGAASTVLQSPTQIDSAVASFTGSALTHAVSAAENNVTIPCFCPGTLIRTDRGEVAVENLQTGDTVITLAGQRRRLCWIGQGKALVTRGRRSAATPVVIRKGALADNVPHNDLRITKGHSLYIDDVLIPAEFLVNHRSILWDDHTREVTVYHLELDTHEVLLANGAPAESYRDDGNRWLFQNANSGWDQPPKPPCAPVLTGGPIVDAVWRRLLDRAGPRPGFLITDDPDLHILVDGQRVDAISRHEAIHVFPLISAPASIKIVSRAGAPGELGLARDPRVLGVALKRITLRQGRRLRVTEAADPILAEGFHGYEPANKLRWTDGDARLPAMLFKGFDGPMELLLHVGGAAQYPLLGEERVRQAA